MSRPRFLADHDVRASIVAGVRRAEPLVEILTARRIGMERRSDAEMLAFAAINGMIVVSHDVNTMSAAAYARISSSEPMCGLVLARQSLSDSVIRDGILLIWGASEAEEWLNQVCHLPI